MANSETLCFDERHVEQASAILREGGVVAIPTETVYGLAGRIDSERALEHIFEAKGRPSDNPLIVHVASVDEIERIAIFTTDARRLAESFMPGPLTLVLRQKHALSTLVTAGLTTVAVRVPGMLLTRQIIASVGVPLAAPSANTSGGPSPTTAQHVLADLHGKIDAVLDGGPCSQGLESTVVDCTANRVRILRPGALSAAELARVLEYRPEIAAPAEGGAPGMRYRHYAPKAAIELVQTLCQLRQKIDQSQTAGCLVIGIIPTRQTLYLDLRAADSLNVEKILVLCDANVEKDHALMNRLRKAIELDDQTDPHA